MCRSSEDPNPLTSLSFRTEPKHVQRSLAIVPSRLTVEDGSLKFFRSY